MTHATLLGRLSRLVASAIAEGVYLRHHGRSNAYEQDQAVARIVTGHEDAVAMLGTTRAVPSADREPDVIVCERCEMRFSRDDLTVGHTNYSCEGRRAARLSVPPPSLPTGGP